MPSTRRRIGAAVAAIAVAASLTTISSPAQAAPPTPLGNAATWLSAQLTNGVIHDGQYDFDDVGTTIYTAYALEAAGGHSATVTDIVGAVAAHLSGASGYIDADECYPVSDPCAVHGQYANATANALVFAEAEGQDVGNYGGVDLVARLESLMTATGVSAGRIADDSSYGDYANTIGQALAAHGLQEAASSQAGAALTFLLDQQCDAGYFRLSFTPDVTAADQTCQGGVASGASAPDTDVTAMVIRQLQPLAAGNTDVATALAKAKTWLAAQQHADGSFGGGPSTSAPNTNSTGLAGWALGTLGDTAAAAKAATWVRAHQVQPLAACASKLSNQTGAIAYDDAALSAGEKNGLTTATLGQWRVAAAQAAPVLQWAPAATGTLGVAGPKGFVRAGSKATYAVSGVAPGSPVCLAVGSARATAIAGSTGKINLALTLPSGTANRTATASGVGVQSSVVTKVLGKKAFKVKAPAKVKRGKKASVTVSGLSAGEKYVVSLRGKVVKRGVAPAGGKVAFKLAVGKKPGKAKIKVTGQFPSIRSGAKTVKVVK